MADFELDAPEPQVRGRSLVPGLLNDLRKHAEKNGRLVQAVNAVSRYASDQEECMQLLVDKGLLAQLRITFKETKFVAPRAAIAQCLSLFANSNRFRDLVGVRYGFVSSAIARLIMFHSLMGLPALDMDEAERAKVFPAKPDIERMQVRMGAMSGAAMQELVLGLIVLLRLCCVSSESAAAAAKLPTVALLLDFLELFGDGDGHRYQLWQLNLLKLMQNMLSHDAASRELAASRPLLSRFLGLLTRSSDHFMSREERIVSTGVLQGVFNMTSQLRLHSILIEVELADVLVRYAAGAAVECVAAESWLDDPDEDDSTLPAEPARPAEEAKSTASATKPANDSNRTIILRSTQLCLACMVNMAAGEQGCDALIPKVLGHGCPAMWELLMVNDTGVQLTLLRLFWRLYVVSRREDRLADSDQMSRAGYELQQAAILRCCLRISNPEPVLFEAMQILDAIAVPDSATRISSEHEYDDESGFRSSGRDIRTPLGFAELQEEVMTRGTDVGHLFAALTNPPSSRTGYAALRLVFRCAHNAPPAAVVQIAQQMLELCADADISGSTPLLRVGPPDMLRRMVCWVHHILNIDEGQGRLELVDALAPQLLTEDWAPVLVDCFRTALEASLTTTDANTGTLRHQDHGAVAAAEAREWDDESRPCGFVPLKSVLEYFRELCDLLLSLAAKAGGYGMGTLLNARMDGGHADGAGVGLVHCVLACVGVYSKLLWTNAESMAGGGVLEFVYGDTMGEINELCIRLLLRFALHRPALLGTGDTSGIFELSRLGAGGLVRDGKEQVGWLSWAVSRAYWLQSVLLTLHHCSRPTQVLAAAQLLLLASEPAQSPDGFSELLSVKKPPTDEAAGSTDSQPGYVFEALVACIRRVWSADADVSTPHQTTVTHDGVGGRRDNPLHFERLSDAITLTHHVCHVLTRLLASLDVDGPFFVVSSDISGGSNMPVSEPASPRRQSAVVVEQLVSVLVLLVGQPSLRDDEDYAFLLALLMPLWHFSTSPIHANVLLTANRGSLVTSLSHWLRSHLIGPLNPPVNELNKQSIRNSPTHDGRFEPGVSQTADASLQLRVRSSVCGILCCISRLQESHREIVTRPILTGLLRAVGIDGDAGSVDNSHRSQGGSKQSYLHTGVEIWEDFILGILRNVLLVDRSEHTAVALRPFIPWLAACLTEVDLNDAPEGVSSRSPGRSEAGLHAHHPRMVPAPHVRTVVGLMSETLLNKETLAKCVSERKAKAEQMVAEKRQKEQRAVEAAQGLQWNERGERGVMAGDADVPKAMASMIEEQYKLMLASKVG